MYQLKHFYNDNVLNGYNNTELRAIVKWALDQARQQKAIAEKANESLAEYKLKTEIALEKQKEKVLKNLLCNPVKEKLFLLYGDRSTVESLILKCENINIKDCECPE